MDISQDSYLAAKRKYGPLSEDDQYMSDQLNGKDSTAQHLENGPQSSTPDYGMTVTTQKNTPVDLESSPGTDLKTTALTGAGSGLLASGGNPYGAAAGAGIKVVGSYLNNKMAQNAADERNKRALLAQSAEDHGKNEQNAFNNILQSFRAAMLGK